MDLRRHKARVGNSGHPEVGTCGELVGRHNGKEAPHFLSLTLLIILELKLTRRDREVVEVTRSRVKNNTELTNLGN